MEYKTVYSSEILDKKKKYSLALTESQWQEIINVLWLEHDFDFANKLIKTLSKKYPEIYLK